MPWCPQLCWPNTLTRGCPATSSLNDWQQIKLPTEATRCLSLPNNQANAILSKNWNKTRSLQIKFTLRWHLTKITQHDQCKRFSSKREEAEVTALVGTSCLIRPNLDCKINYIQLKTLYFIRNDEEKTRLVNSAAALEVCWCRNSEANATTEPRLSSTHHPHRIQGGF